jgi:hypothetical protein
VGGIHTIWEARVVHLLAKPILLSCLWKCHHVLFLLVQCVGVDDEWFVFADRFFFFFILFSLF